MTESKISAMDIAQVSESESNPSATVTAPSTEEANNEILVDEAAVPKESDGQESVDSDKPVSISTEHSMEMKTTAEQRDRIETVSQDIPDTVSQDIPETVSEDIPKTVSQDNPETVSQDIPEKSESDVQQVTDSSQPSIEQEDQTIETVLCEMSANSESQVQVKDKSQSTVESEVTPNETETDENTIEDLKTTSTVEYHTVGGKRISIETTVTTLESSVEEGTDLVKEKQVQEELTNFICKEALKELEKLQKAKQQTVGACGDRKDDKDSDSDDDDNDNGSPRKKLRLEVELEKAPVTPTVKTFLTNNADFSAPPLLIGESFTAFHKRRNEGNFLKGCKWSADGKYLLTNSNDNVLRTFHNPSTIADNYVHAIVDLDLAAQQPAGGVVYDFAWNPKIQDNGSQSFIFTSRDAPIHMCSADTGAIQATYRAYDQADELTAAHSLAFSQDGRKIYTGYNKTIRIFDTERPGRQCVTRHTFKKQGQPGIISCIAINPSLPTIYAAGSYSRVVALYTEPKGNMMCMFEGQAGGVTHLKFSPDGSKLFTGGRKDSEILCWDMRMPGHILFTLQRKASTNQRMYFDLDSTGRYLVSGMHDGSVRVWDILAAPTAATAGAEPVLPPIQQTDMHLDTLNGVSLHPSLPILATASGQRHFPIPSGLESSDDTDSEADRDNSLRLWWYGGCRNEGEEQIDTK